MKYIVLYYVSDLLSFSLYYETTIYHTVYLSIVRLVVAEYTTNSEGSSEAGVSSG